VGFGSGAGGSGTTESSLQAEQRHMAVKTTASKLAVLMRVILIFYLTPGTLKANLFGYSGVKIKKIIIFG
jgi:hypothetical protein